MCFSFCFGKNSDAGPAEEAGLTEPSPVTTPAIIPTQSPLSPPSPQVKQQIPDVPESLPSQVDETLAECPKFRIVLVGNAGVGKSSLIKRIFNLDQDKIDVADGRAGKANIEQEYTSSVNPRFILHDSKGFEAGSGVNWDAVENFLQSRWKRGLPEKIHAIWFCVTAPLKGGRLLQTGDEKLLQFAKKFNIPIIAVFTKYDVLVTQFYRQGNESEKFKQKRTEAAEKNASASFDSSVKELQEEWAKSSTDLSIPCVKVSTEDRNAQQTLIDLTNKTRSTLSDVEGELQVLWVAAQQVNARQKVEVSISEGFKKYWRDLGQSSVFEDKILIDCIHRIHDDVLKVWNFNDSTKILSGTTFFTEMIGLLKPLIDDHVKKNKHSISTQPVTHYGKTGATVLRPLLRDFGFDPQANQYLCGKYQKYISTGKLLATYIINLVLVLYRLFADILPTDPPRDLTDTIVKRIIGEHKNQIKDVSFDEIKPEFTAQPEQVIEHLIREWFEPPGNPEAPAM